MHRWRMLPLHLMSDCTNCCTTCCRFDTHPHPKLQPQSRSLRTLCVIYDREVPLLLFWIAQSSSNIHCTASFTLQSGSTSCAELCSTCAAFGYALHIQLSFREELLSAEARIAVSLLINMYRSSSAAALTLCLACCKYLPFTEK